MSLLLDALKKAADDKKKVSQGDSVEPVPSNDVLSEADFSTNVTDDNADKKASEAVTEITEEFMLDSIDANTVEASEDAAVEEMESAPQEGEVEAVQDEPSSRLDESLKDSSAASYTVSDEALSMLIRKTNRDVKQGKRWLLASVLLVSLVVLVSGGFYYYLDMQAEIANLERKHQIAMQSMKSKTSKEKTPEKSEIVRSLVSGSDLDDKVQYAKKHMAKEKRSQQVKPGPEATLKDNYKTGAAPSAVSFQKTKKTDPVAEKLEAAWIAYESAEYSQAKKLYKDVLRTEENNRDALLGLGAIAVIEKNNVVARSVYSILLKHDPRDPIAISALASLRNSEAATDADEKYLLNMLQKNPDDTHLNFALGNIYAQQNKWKMAQQSYFNAWQSDNKNADYIFNLAVSMDQLGKQKQAVVLYRDCLSNANNKQVSFSREVVQKRITELSGL